MIYIALPAMNESDNMEAFVNCCLNQTYSDFKLVVCVNQPDDWWERQDKVAICHDNQSTLSILSKIKDIPVVIIDRCSKGNGMERQRFRCWLGAKNGHGSHQ